MYSVGSRFACDMPGIELGDGGSEVVEVECDERNDPPVCVDFADGERLGNECLGP